MGQEILAFLTVNQIGVNSAGYGSNNGSNHENPETDYITEKYTQEYNYPGNYKKLTGKAVGLLPDPFTGQCPGNLESNKIIMLDFRHVITHDNK